MSHVGCQSIAATDVFAYDWFGFRLLVVELEIQARRIAAGIHCLDGTPVKTGNECVDCGTTRPIAVF
jgi:hypothetical protein